MAAQVLAGLQVAHARGLLHRDIKPSNVLIDRFPDNIKLSDFGLASSVLLEQEDRAIGTPQFSSPEQIRGEPIDQRTDLFGFGCFLYSLLVGRSPFAGSSRLQTIQMTLESLPEPLSHFGVAAPASLQSLLDRLLAKEREQRPRDAEEVSALLASIRQASSVAEPSSPSRRRWLWAAGGLALLSGLAYRYSGGSRGSRPLLPSRSPIKLRVVDGSLTPFLYSHDKATLVKSEPLTLTKPIHYWRASSAGEAGTIIYRFEFSEPLKSCRLKAHLFCAFGFDEQAWAKLWIGPRMETMYQAVGFSLDRMEYWPVLGSKSSRPIMTLEDSMAVTGHPGWIDASAIIQGSRYLFLKAELFGSLDISSNAGISLGPAGAQFLREDPQRDEFSLSLEPSA